MNETLTWVVILITSGGIVLSLACVYAVMQFTTGEVFECHAEGCAYWTHMFIHVATTVITIAMQLVRDNYEQTVTIAGGSLMLKLTTGYWHMDGDLWAATDSLANIQARSISIPLHCCMQLTDGA